MRVERRLESDWSLCGATVELRWGRKRQFGGSEADWGLIGNTVGTLWEHYGDTGWFWDEKFPRPSTLPSVAGQRFTLRGRLVTVSKGEVLGC